MNLINPLYSEAVMETFLLVYNCFVFVLFVAAFAINEDKSARRGMFILSVIQVLDIACIVRMIRG